MKHFTFFILLLSFSRIGAQPLPISYITDTHISKNLIWSNDTIYQVEKTVTIMPGYTLTICPGTRIQFNKNGIYKNGLRIARGAKIYADGSAAPIVFTSAQPTPAPGDWVSLIILGAAPDLCDNNPLGENCVDAGGMVDSLEEFGNGSPDDNSGVLRNIRIEYAGGTTGDGGIFPGIALAGVGTGTLIDGIEVYRSAEVGFMFVGGTVNCEHLIANQCAYEDFRFTRKYLGKIQFAYCLKDPAFAKPGSGSIRILEFTDPSLSNFTIAGPVGPNVSPEHNRLFRFHPTKGGIFNSVLLGNFKTGLYFNNFSNLQNYLTNDSMEVKNTLLSGPGTLFAASTNQYPVDLQSWFFKPSSQNIAPTNINFVELNDPFNLSSPDARPLAGSPVWGAASFSSSARLNDPFFEVVDYIGAFGNEDWTAPWASWHNQTFSLPPCISSQNNPASSDFEFRIAPQPAQNEAVLSGLPAGSDYTVDVYDISGRIQQANWRILPAAHTGYLDLSALPNGYYIVQVKSKVGNKAKPLVIAR